MLPPFSRTPPPPGRSSEAEEPVRTLPEARRLTRDRVRDLGALVLKYAERHLPALPRTAPAPPEPPRVTGRHALALRYLRAIPVVLSVLFVLSFFWDFTGIVVTLPGASLPLEGLLRLTSVSGLIGFLTNWLAITMLFQPRERRPIFGQGLVPAQRERVIFRLAQAISTQLINEQIIQRKIQESGVLTKYRDVGLQVTRGILEDPEFRADFREMVIDYVARVVRSSEVRTRLADIAVQKLEKHAGEGISGLALRIYRYFNEEEFQIRVEMAINEIPNAIDAVLDSSDAFLDRLPDRIEARAEELERWITRALLAFVGQLDIYGMVRSNMEKYDESQLENLLKSSNNEQLNYIKYLGGVLGFFGGFVIWKPLLALGFLVVVGGSLAGLDVFLFRRKQARKRASSSTSDGAEHLDESEPADPSSVTV